MTARPPLDPAAHLHQTALLDAMHRCAPVLFEGRYQFLQVLTPRLDGGRVQMDVFLTGRAGPIDSSLIQINNQENQHG